MPGFADPSEYEAARAVLERHHFSYDAISNTLKSEDWFTARAIDLPPFIRRAAGADPHATLVRLFLLGCEVDADDVLRAVQPMSLDQWVRAGLVVQSDENSSEVFSPIRMIPIEGHIFAADKPYQIAADASAKFVMLPGGTSLQLGWSAIARPSRHTLDMGTGCGYLAINAARFSDHIVATDRNERATEFTNFNARLNAISGLDCRVGNLFDTVNDERFDLILSNPPFVITPQQRLMFRDSGIRGDEFCRQLVREAPELLADGGYCQLLANFAHRSDRPWQDDLASWFADARCDALVLITRQQSSDEYAMEWVTATESQDPLAVPKIFDDWMSFYEQQRIEKISYLHVTLRRRNDAQGSVQIDSEPIRITGQCGELIVRRFALLDFLSSRRGDEALLAEHFRLDDHGVVVQEHAMTTDGPVVAANRLEMRGGLRHTAKLDARVLRLLASSDGQTSLGQVLDEMAGSLGIDRTRVIEIALPAVRHLIERGILIPRSLQSGGDSNA